MLVQLQLLDHPLDQRILFQDLDLSRNVRLGRHTVRGHGRRIDIFQVQEVVIESLNLNRCYRLVDPRLEIADAGCQKNR